MEKIYNKLVRDKIPEIIIGNNGKPYTRVLKDDEYKKELEKKLFEEYNEMLESTGRDRIEELSDMLEIMGELSALENASLDEVTNVMKEKRKKRGGFKKKIYLEKVIE